MIWQQRMYTQVAADLYTGELAGGQLHSRSALDSFSQISQSLAGAVPFGFCCGGFSSTAGYVPGNEAQIRRPERLATTSRLIISSKARLRFYPRRSRKPCDFPEAKPFGFQRGRNSCNSRLLPLPNNASPHRFASPLAGHDARERRDRMCVILSPQKQVKQKIL